MKKDRKFKGWLQGFLRWPLYLGVLVLLMTAAAFAFNIRAGLICAGLTVIYLIVGLWFYVVKRPMIMREVLLFAGDHAQIQKKLIAELDIPYALLDEGGKILWINRAFGEVIHRDKNWRRRISDFFPEAQAMPEEDETVCDVSYENRYYKLHLKNIYLEEPGEDGYKAMVERIKTMLHQGEAIQVVPSVHFSQPFRGDGFGLYRRMRRINASPYMFYMHLPGISLFGSSPEVMVRCSKGELHLAPIAGTRPRGRDDFEDHQLELDLLSDPKERAEHVMLVDLGRNDLGRIAEKGSVHVDRLMQIERFSHVMHLTSQVSARLKAGLDAVDVLAATFPAGTVSGAPKIRAMEILREMEGRPRGPYAGSIGWIGLDRESVSLDMGITIRSMWIRNGRLNWQAGAGIVHDSVPEKEWKEVCNKSAIMRQSLLNTEEGAHVSLHR